MKAQRSYFVSSASVARPLDAQPTAATSAVYSLQSSTRLTGGQWPRPNLAPSAVLMGLAVAAAAAAKSPTLAAAKPRPMPASVGIFAAGFFTMGLVGCGVVLGLHIGLAVLGTAAFTAVTGGFGAMAMVAGLALAYVRFRYRRARASASVVVPCAAHVPTKLPDLTQIMEVAVRQVHHNVDIAKESAFAAQAMDARPSETSLLAKDLFRNKGHVTLTAPNVADGQATLPDTVTKMIIDLQTALTDARPLPDDWQEPADQAELMAPLQQIRDFKALKALPYINQGLASEFNIQLFTAAADFGLQPAAPRLDGSASRIAVGVDTVTVTNSAYYDMLQVTAASKPVGRVCCDVVFHLSRETLELQKIEHAIKEVAE